MVALNYHAVYNMQRQKKKNIVSRQVLE